MNCGIESGCGRRLILASASPRRKELLADAGYVFEVIPAAVDEQEIAAHPMSASSLAELLSAHKARAVAALHRNATVIGADTVVALGNEVFGKPDDLGDARRMLGLLMHHSHRVITGVTILDGDTGRHDTNHVVTQVTMNPMPPARFEAYLESGLRRGKAGAYGLQDHDDAFVERIEGSQSNVVGLPMEYLVAALLRWGHAPVR